MPKRYLISAAACLVLAACGSGNEVNLSTQPTAPAATAAVADAEPFNVTAMVQFDEPWAMTFLPDQRLLVTEKRGTLKLLRPGSTATSIRGVPAVDYGGQGGLGDVVLHPQFAQNQLIYLSYVEAGADNTRGAVVARARIALDDADGGSLSALEVIWRQQPKVTGRGHFGHRIAFDDEGMLWISSSERQKFDPAQDMQSNLGKLVRLHDDGSLPLDNPFSDQGEVAAQVWSLGHRNILGMAFDAQGRLWAHEMGPAGGDELNVIERGVNYGYPLVSEGDHYDGRAIPRHASRTEFRAPALSWNPVISPAGLVIYSGEQFPQWRGNALIGGLSSQALIRVALDGEGAREAARYPMSARIREVEQGPDGAIWLLEDGPEGRLLKLTPVER